MVDDQPAFAATRFASADLGRKLIGFVSVSATASKDDGNYQAVTVGVRMPL